MNKNSNLIVLVVLGLIWSTFALFTKVAALEISPVFIAFGRLAVGAILLFAISLLTRRKIFIRKNYRQYTLVGIFNFIAPFILIASAVRFLDSGVVTILNGTVPMFEMLMSIFLLKLKVERHAIIGIILGLIGVIITSFGNIRSLDITSYYVFAVLAMLLATNSYAGASIYIKSSCKNIPSMTMVTGSMIFAALILSPCIFFTDFSTINAKSASSLFMLGFLCTGIAYVFFFKLIEEESSRIAVSVTLLVPVFGVINGVIFLGENLPLNKIIGCATILVSMKFILNLSLKDLLKSRKNKQ